MYKINTFVLTVLLIFAVNGCSGHHKKIYKQFEMEKLEILSISPKPEMEENDFRQIEKNMSSCKVPFGKEYVVKKTDKIDFYGMLEFVFLYDSEISPDIDVYVSIYKLIDGDAKKLFWNEKTVKVDGESNTKGLYRLNKNKINTFSGIDVRPGEVYYVVYYAFSRKLITNKKTIALVKDGAFKSAVKETVSDSKDQKHKDGESYVCNKKQSCEGLEKKNEELNNDLKLCKQQIEKKKEAKISTTKAVKNTKSHNKCSTYIKIKPSLSRPSTSQYYNPKNSKCKNLVIDVVNTKKKAKFAIRIDKTQGFINTKNMREVSNKGNMVTYVTENIHSKRLRVWASVENPDEFDIRVWHVTPDFEAKMVYIATGSTNEKGKADVEIGRGIPVENKKFYCVKVTKARTTTKYGKCRVISQKDVVSKRIVQISYEQTNNKIGEHVENMLKELYVIMGVENDY